MPGPQAKLLRSDALKDEKEFEPISGLLMQYAVALMYIIVEIHSVDQPRDFKPEVNANEAQATRRKFPLNGLNFADSWRS